MAADYTYELLIKDIERGYSGAWHSIFSRSAEEAVISRMKNLIKKQPELDKALFKIIYHHAWGRTSKPEYYLGGEKVADEVAAAYVFPMPAPVYRFSTTYATRYSESVPAFTTDGLFYWAVTPQALIKSDRSESKWGKIERLDGQPFETEFYVGGKLTVSTAYDQMVENTKRRIADEQRFLVEKYEKYLYPITGDHLTAVDTDKLVAFLMRLANEITEAATTTKATDFKPQMEMLAKGIKQAVNDALVLRPVPTDEE